MRATAQPPIAGTTRLIAMIGDPIHAAKSPLSFNPRLAARGHDAVLVPLHIRADDFDDAIGPIMRLGNLAGIVVTMPFKERLLPHLAAVSERAADVGAVNAVRPAADGGWEGDIFDGVGLVGAVRGLGMEPGGLAVGLIGAGGAGAAIAFALAAGGVRALTIVDRDGPRAERLAARVAAKGGVVPQAAPSFAPAAVDVVVNASPVGMTEGDAPPLDVSGLTARTAVVDIVTRPGTALLTAAARAGCRHAGGAAMVAAQTDAILGFLGFADPSAPDHSGDPS